MGSLTSSPKAPPIPQTDYNAQAQSQIQILEAQNRMQQQQQQAQRDYEAQQRAQQQEQFGQNLSTAQEQARARALADISGRGLDPSQYGLQDQLERMIQQITGQVPQLDQNPGSYFANQNIGDLVLGQATANQRNQYTRAFDEFAGSGFADQRIASTADDAILEAILGEQYNPALQQLQSAFERGTLNQQGFDTGINSLNSQRSAAMAQLQST